MTTPAKYLSDCRILLIMNPIIQSYEIVDAYADDRKGYLRIRAVLLNGDFLEIAEYFVLKDDKLFTEDYRFQWMDAEKSVLKYRWDNTPHFPELPDFPHHLHVGDTVQGHHAMNISKVLDEIEAFLPALK